MFRFDLFNLKWYYTFTRYYKTTRWEVLQFVLVKILDLK